MELMDETPGDITPGNELAKKARLQSGGGYEPPAVGSWHWVEADVELDEYEPAKPGEVLRHKTKREPVLMYVEEVYSNHVRFYRHGEDGHGFYEQIAHHEILARSHPEPAWREHILKDMEDVQLAIREKTAALLEDAIKKNALPPTGQDAAPSASGLELSLRVVAPAKQKADLMSVQANLRETQKEIAELAKEYAGLCKNLVGGEMAVMHRTADSLKVLEDKIFVVEVYAGLQEHVRQIAEGQPAPSDTRITVRQSMLYMDEETLIDWERGGMDYTKLHAFDEWVVRPRNLNRVLPEKRGVVAFRVRRNEKDYGRPENIGDAMRMMAENEENFRTYLLLRNGENVFRIASGVSFSPRLIPMRNEFEDAFRDEDRWHYTKAERDAATVREIGPDHFDYDKKVNDLKKRLGGYNKIVVLIQGLLDRSDVFHPHLPINLSLPGAIDEWLNLVRDEEDVVEYNGVHWRKYFEDRRAMIQPGTIIYCQHIDFNRSWRDDNRPHIIKVEKLRKCNAGDRAKYNTYNSRAYQRGRREYDAIDVPELGTPGVEVSWTFDVERYSKAYTIPVPEKPGYYSRRHWTESVTRRQWLPLSQTYNVSDYRPGDFKFFLADRRQKAEYAKWTHPCFEAEDYYRNLNKLDTNK